MRVKNPNYVAPVATYAAAKKDGFAAWLAAAPQKAKPWITFDEIRAAFPAEVDPVEGGPLSDGTIAAVLALLGYEVAS